MSPRDPGRSDGPKPPKTEARLDQLIGAWQQDTGLPVRRLNLRIAAMVLAGALGRAAASDGQPAFATKGGVAMELWIGNQARPTRDIDLVLRGNHVLLPGLLDRALAEPYNGFSFLPGALEPLPSRPSVTQVTVRISFARRVLASPRVEISPLDVRDEDFVELPAVSLKPVGLHGPELVPVLAGRWQIAQKLHAVTERLADGRENARFRDLIELQLLETLGFDLPDVRDACEQVFAGA